MHKLPHVWKGKDYLNWPVRQGRLWSPPVASTWRCSRPASVSPPSEPQTSVVNSKYRKTCVAHNTSLKTNISSYGWNVDLGLYLKSNSVTYDRGVVIINLKWNIVLTQYNKMSIIMFTLTYLCKQFDMRVSLLSIWRKYLWHFNGT